MNKIAVESRITKYKGVFDWKGLFNHIKGWLLDREYDVYESTHKDKPGAIGREIEVVIKADRKLNEYVQNFYEVKIHIWDMVMVDVVKEGKQQKLADGRMKIDFDAYFVMDYSENWEDKSFYKKLENFFHNKVILWDWRVKYYDPLDYELHAFKDSAEQLLGMSGHSAY